MNRSNARRAISIGPRHCLIFAIIVFVFLFHTGSAGACAISHEGWANSSSPDAIRFVGAPDLKLPDDAALIVVGKVKEEKISGLPGRSWPIEIIEVLKGALPSALIKEEGLMAYEGLCGVGPQLRVGKTYFLFYSDDFIRELPIYDSGESFAAEVIPGAAWLKDFKDMMSPELYARLSAKN